MKFLSKLLLLLLLLNHSLYAKEDKIDLSMVISGGVSLGAYEAGYNWAMVKMLTNVKNHSQLVDPHLRSVTGASAGSINALLTAMYWCQRDDIGDQNSIDNNLFYNTWVELGLNDLIIQGRDPHNKSTLFTRDTLKLKADEILKHLNKPIYQQGCEVPLGFSVTKATPIITEFQKTGIQIKNQHFSIPFTLKEKDNRLTILNKTMPKSTDYHIAIPSIENNISKVINVLFASSAFPGAFQQVKLDYIYEGEQYSSYFIDGGAYDNLPLQLATELDRRAVDFVFIDPSNMRGESKATEEEEKEEQPVGFLGANALPLINAVDIFQSMRLYNAITQYFGEDSLNKLILSSRYHPIAGKFLGHFGAFLNQDFRIYDYHVGVYDAIYHLSKSMHERGYFREQSQEALMNRLKKGLGIEQNPEALHAYNLFFQTEFGEINDTTVEVNDRFSAIYRAFDHTLNDDKRYDVKAFNSFLTKLDLSYIQDKDSFIPQNREEIDNWYKEPLNLMINRISTLENDYAQIEGNSKALAKVTNMMAWMGSNLVKEKKGFHIPLNIPEDKSNSTLANVLKALPSEITNDVKNGGVGVSYNAYFYQKESYMDAFEGKISYNQSDDISSFLRFDFNAFKEYQDFLKVGVGASFFGNVESTFYDEEGLYGFNTYVDLLDIFRLTYVRRFDHPTESNYIYFGLRNLPSLIYWLQR
ncbi:MAG: patatin-like phospholipase family protein [Epsilonproteobacteria bacterium]|nr:patatin-like phospholipase family protein [Campylobacterota bacterium]